MHHPVSTERCTLDEPKSVFLIEYPGMAEQPLTTHGLGSGRLRNTAMQGSRVVELSDQAFPCLVGCGGIQGSSRLQRLRSPDNAN